MLLSSTRACGSGAGAMLAYCDRTGGVFGVLAAAIDSWQPMRNRRWAHTSLRLVLPMRTMASTWAPETSFTMRPSHLTGTGARWKRFLSHGSHSVIRYGSDPQGPMPCGVQRSFGGRARDLEKTAIAY